ncbi:hypothetical protein DFH27DRAFT_527439 [Peziza echinospora]|nr:hypothetical protein DFH27DRAFT_527439 [Peziza echinospora]
MTVIPQPNGLKAGEETSSDLFPETVILAVWIIFYTFVSAMCALFTHILFRLNKQKAVYVSLMCFSIFLQQCVTMIQQGVALGRWRILQEEVYREDIEIWRNPYASVVYAINPDVVMRIIFAIRVYFFNVESLLFFFWSLLLCLSLWEVKWHWARSQTFIVVSRYVCFILPGLQAMAISLPPVKAREILHLVLMDSIMVVTMTFGAVFLMLVLIKLVIVAMSSKRAPSMRDDRRKSKSNKEDRWLMLRFLISFLVLVALQTSFLYSQYDYAKIVIDLRKSDAAFPSIGWTKMEQLKDWAFYMAGSSTGILIALVFATTPESRSQARKLWRMNCSGFGARRKNKNRRSSPTPPPLLSDQQMGEKGRYEDNHIPIILEPAHYGPGTEKGGYKRTSRSTTGSDIENGGPGYYASSEKSSTTTKFEYYDIDIDPATLTVGHNNNNNGTSTRYYQTITPPQQSPPPTEIAQASMFLAFPAPAASALPASSATGSSGLHPTPVYKAYKPPQSSSNNIHAIMPDHNKQQSSKSYRESSYRSFGTEYETYSSSSIDVGLGSHTTDLRPPPPLPSPQPLTHTHNAHIHGNSNSHTHNSSINPYIPTDSAPVSPQQEFEYPSTGMDELMHMMDGIVSPLTPQCDAFPPHAAFRRAPSGLGRGGSVGGSGSGRAVGGGGGIGSGGSGEGIGIGIRE